MAKYVPSSSGLLLVVALFIACVLPVACGGGGLNSQPRITTVPTQNLSSGSSLALDLAPYVSDKEGAALTWSVLSGGGSFTQSTYSNTFDTIGTYTVAVRVSDPGGKSSDTSFRVVVQSAHLAVVQAGTSLRVADTVTQNVLTVSDATGFVDTLKATLETGFLIYERSVGSDRNLYAYDVARRSTTVLGDSTTSSEQYAGKTSDGKVIFTTGSSTDQDLHIWNSTTGVTRVISAQVGEHDRHPVVSSDDLVYFEYGVEGQPDIHVYDPATDQSEPLAEGATAETLVAALGNGAILFQRIGGGGESDLFYYRPATGIVEVGADLSTTVQNQTKTYRCVTSDNKVIFEVSQPTTTDLYVWNPAGGASRLIAANASFAAVTALDQIVYHLLTGVGNRDLLLYDYASNHSTVISNTGDDEYFEGSLANGDIVFSLFFSGDSSIDLNFYDVSTDTVTAIGNAGSDDFVFKKVLANGKVVYLHELATPVLRLFDTVALTSSVVVTSAGADFAGELTGGDFVYTVTVSGQTDLFLYDESATASVEISSVTGNDVFGAALPTGNVLFTRVPAGQSTADLYFWNQGDGSTSRLTTTALQHGVVDTFTATRN